MDLAYIDIEQTATAIVAVVGALVVAYRKFKHELDKSVTSIRQHTDVSVSKLNGMVRYIIHSYGGPMWVKVATENPRTGAMEFRMVEVNRQYTERFGLSRDKYIGKTDLEAGWDKETASEFYQHDLAVWASGEPQTFTETIDGKKLRFRKVRLMSDDGTIKGVMGYASDCGDPKNCPYYTSSCKECHEKEENQP